MLSYIESLVGIGCFARNDKFEGSNYHYMTIIRLSLLVYIYLFTDTLILILFYSTVT